MRVLGLVGSRRRVGNTEILVKQALKGARDQGAEVALIKLSDLNVQPCNGCMACMTKGEHCRLKDDMDFLGEEIAKSDGLVLGAPSYHYKPMGIFCLIDDRLHGLTLPKERRKMAVSIGTAGMLERSGWVVPMLNLFLRFTRQEIVGSLMAVSAGPGEVLFDGRDSLMKETYSMGTRLVDALRDESTRIHGVDRFKIFDPRRKDGDKLYTPGYCCPYCFSEAFQFIAPDTVRCCFCYDQTGKVVHKKDGGVTIQFPEMSEDEMRRRLDEHFAVWVAGTGPWFVQQRDKYKDSRLEFARIDIPWLTPPSQQQAEVKVAS